jgi:hypothetical protein
MTHEQEMATVDGVLEAIGTRGDGEGRVTRADLWPAHGTAGSSIPGAAVNLYYDRSIGLAAIAIDARRARRWPSTTSPRSVGRRPAWRTRSATTSPHAAGTNRSITPGRRRRAHAEVRADHPVHGHGLPSNASPARPSS